MKVMKKVLTVLILSTLSIFAFAQDDVKRVAILETVDKLNTVSYMMRLMFRSNLTTAITNTVGYEGYDRVDLAQITGEQNFQRTGLVSDADIKKIGEFTGAKYVLIAEATVDGEDLFITAKIIDVETARVVRNSNQLMKTSSAEMEAGSKKVAADLLGVKTGSSSVPPSTHNYQANKQDFTETAFGVNMKMIWVEGGDFLMGCTSEQSGSCDSDEQNVRRVTVDGFYIGMLEVTQAQWEKVMGTSIYQQKAKASADNTYGVGPDYPMYYVSWEEAMEFCRQLSIKTGRTYTLPTEAQWEYAARGGNRPDGTKYAGSNMIDLVAWYTDNSGSSTHICGSKRANSLGIYDMSGNVYEWCKDWYGNSYMSYDTNNPTGPSSGSYRVLRGGYWNSSAQDCRVAYRDGNTPTNRYDGIGFRVVLLP